MSNPYWKTLTLDHIKTEKDQIKACIIANNERRQVSMVEKVELLGELAKILMDEEGVPVGEISRQISKETGMSYQRVMKYLPEEFKRGYNSLHRRARALVVLLR